MLYFSIIYLFFGFKFNSCFNLSNISSNSTEYGNLVLFSLIYKKSLIPPTSESGSHSVRYRYSDQIKDTFSLP